MKRILFLDDEPQVLDGLKVALRGHRRQWQQRFVSTGDEALEMLRAEPFDIVVSDIRMPGMSGSLFLSRVKEEFPQIIRIVLSGFAESEALTRTVKVTHQYLSKPCRVDKLSAAIDRGCRVHDLMDNEAIRRLVGGISRLPSVPRVYHELNQLIASDEATPKKIAAVLEQDMAMCVKILQLVNSAFFRVAREISNVQQAVAYLGFDTVSLLVLSAEVFGRSGESLKLPGWDLQSLQQHSLQAARLAGQLVADPGQKSEAILSGMLHDVGQLVLATGAPVGFGRALSLASDQSLSLHQAEREVFGVDHGAVGGYLLGLWGLPYSTVEAVAGHHNHDRDMQEPLDAGDAVYLANQLLNELQAESKNPDFHGFRGFIEANGLAERLTCWRALAAAVQPAAADAAA